MVNRYTTINRPFCVSTFHKIVLTNLLTYWQLGWFVLFLNCFQINFSKVLSSDNVVANHFSRVQIQILYAVRQFLILAKCLVSTRSKKVLVLFGSVRCDLKKKNIPKSNQKIPKKTCLVSQKCSYQL